MKEIGLEEQKKILVNMLAYIDSICRKNNIKYTLIGGSLIGAVRHHGIIPWDDDIDIGLLPEEYDKLMYYLKNDNSCQYRLLDVDTEPSYYYPFAKLVDLKTTGYENRCKKIKNYGVYVDIFKYNTIPEDVNLINKYYDYCDKLKVKMFRSFINESDNFFKNILHKFLSLQNSNKIARKYIIHSEKYNNEIFNNVMINWTPYGAAKETHLSDSFKEYIDVDFENIKVMIIKDYDRVLKTTFGDYMSLPPVEKQVTHHTMRMFRK